jgi:hypothetical protein
MADGRESAVAADIAINAAPSTLAQAAADFPATTCSRHADDVEVGAIRIALRYECDLAEKFIGAAVGLTFGLQHLQAVVVKRATGGRFTFVGGLNGRDVRGRIARHGNQSAEPFNSSPHFSLPHIFTPSFQIISI